MSVRGRFAPSPTGDLHFGNLRTALVAYLWSVSEGGDFIIRMEDLDRVTSSREIGERQLDDLAAIGIQSNGEVVWQSDRFPIYHNVIDKLAAAGLTYECFCSRREIREAAAAPHGPGTEGNYPGTCRELTEAQRAEKAQSRPAALRLRSDNSWVTVRDHSHGEYTAQVGDVVLRRNDGVPAYHLAVVVDDALQRVTQVCRGEDLLPSTPSHIFLQQLLGYPTPEYLHVSLVMGQDGERLSKRNGAKSLRDYLNEGVDAARVKEMLVESIGGRFGVEELLRVGTWTI